MFTETVFPPNSDKNKEYLEKIQGLAAEFDQKANKNLQERLIHIQNSVEKEEDPKIVVLKEYGKIDNRISDALEKREYYLKLTKTDENTDIAKNGNELVISLEKGGTTKKVEIENLTRVLKINLSQNNTEQAKKTLGELHAYFKNTDRLWKQMINERLIATESAEDIGDNIEQIFSLLKLRQTVKAINCNKSGLNKHELLQLRAKSLLEYQNTISPEILEDLVEGRFDETDPLLCGNIIDGFLQFEEKIEKAKHKLTKKQVLLIGAALSIITTTAIGFTFRKDIAEIFQTQKVEERINKVKEKFEESEDQNKRSEEQNKVAPTKEAQSPSNQSNENQEQTTSANPSEKPNQPNTLYQDSPENSGEFPKGTFWEIEGEIPDVYFQTSESTKIMRQSFGYEKKLVWVNSLVPQQGNPEVLYLEENTSLSPIRIKSQFQVQGFEFEIPTPRGYEPTSFKIEGQNKDHVFNRIYRYQNGMYGATLNPIDDLNKQNVTVTVGFSPKTATQEKLGNQEDIKDASEFPDLKELDAEISTFFSGKHYPNEIQNFIKNHFTYSLDKRYSDFIQRGAYKPGEFVKRAFALPFGDCDVVNTILVLALRQQGYEARMAFGFANGASLLETGRNKLDAQEFHGWAQWFNPKTNRWEDLDATPSKVDEYTEKRLNDLNSGAGVESVLKETDLRKAIRSLEFSWSSLQDFYVTNSELLNIFGLIFGATALSIGSNILRKKQNDFLRKRWSNLNSLLYNKPETKIISNQVGKFWQISDAFYRAGNLETYGLLDKFAFGVAGIFTLPYFLLRKKRIRTAFGNQTVEKTAEQITDETPILDVLQKAYGIPQNYAERKIIENNLSEHGDMQFLSDRAANIMDEKLLVVTPDGVSWSLSGKTELNFDKFIARATNLPDFLRRVGDRYYQTYLETFKSGQRENWPEGNKGEKYISKDVHPIRQEKFMEEIIDVFQIAKVYYELRSAQKNLSKKK